MTKATKQVNLSGLGGQGSVTGRISSSTPNLSNQPRSIVGGKKNFKVSADADGGIMIFEVSSDPNFRSKAEYPYSYDPITTYRDSKLVPNGSAYSDRIFGWYPYDEVRAKQEKHLGKATDYYTGISPAKIQAYLEDVLQCPGLQIQEIQEQCNVATGYPVWYFAYYKPEAAELAVSSDEQDSDKKD